MAKYNLVIEVKEGTPEQEAAKQVAQCLDSLAKFYRTHRSLKPAAKTGIQTQSVKVYIKGEEPEDDNHDAN